MDDSDYDCDYDYDSDIYEEDWGAADPFDGVYGHFFDDNDNGGEDRIGTDHLAVSAFFDDADDDDHHRNPNDTDHLAVSTFFEDDDDDDDDDRNPNDTIVHLAVSAFHIDDDDGGGGGVDEEDHGAGNPPSDVVFDLNEEIHGAEDEFGDAGDFDYEDEVIEREFYGGGGDEDDFFEEDEDEDGGENGGEIVARGWVDEDLGGTTEARVWDVEMDSEGRIVVDGNDDVHIPSVGLGRVQYERRNDARGLLEVNGDGDDGDDGDDNGDDDLGLGGWRNADVNVPRRVGDGIVVVESMGDDGVPHRSVRQGVTLPVVMEIVEWMENMNSQGRVIVSDVGGESGSGVDGNGRMGNRQEEGNAGAASSSTAERKGVEEDQSGVDGWCCPICMDPWSSDGEHFACCLPCGHLYGMSCIKTWLQQQAMGKCPQCNKICSFKDVRRLYLPEITVMDKETQEKIMLLEARCASLELKDAEWCKKEAEWQQKEAYLQQKEADLQQKEADLRLRLDQQKEAKQETHG